MAVFWLTFRIADDSTYSQRYGALIDAVEKTQTTWWVESSSFILFEADKTIDGIASLVRAAVNPAIDVVLIGMPNFKSARIVGAHSDPDLFTLMPFTKKV